MAVAQRNMARLGVSLVEVGDEKALPFPQDSFEFVVSRHPTNLNWQEITRVLRAGGTCLSQQVRPGSNRELTDFMMGRQPVGPSRDPDRAARDAKAFGLHVVDLRRQSLRVEFFDVAAVVYFLGKPVWTFPDFMVEKYRD